MVMGSYFLKIFYALLVLFLHAAGSIDGFNWPIRSGDVKCSERERQSLLNFKQGLQDHFGMLSTWREDQNNGDCCKWRGIECNSETGHVHMLHLRGSETHYLSGEISITSLIELQNMEYLDLSSNHFRGNQIPKHMGSFSKLRYLNLSYSDFGGRIPYQLGNLSQLEYLNLKGNSLVGAIPSQLGKLTHLQYLDLSYNYDFDFDFEYQESSLVGAIPYQLGNLSQLWYLDLGGNYLSGAIPFQIWNLPMLHTLGLGGNFNLETSDVKWLSNFSSLTNLDLGSMHNIHSSHPWQQMISKLLPNLRELRLNDCNISDNDILSLFDSHSNFSTSLTILDLSSNMLTSSTFQLLYNFSFNLQELYLSSNNFVLSSPPYPNFPSLVILDLTYNNLTSSIFQGNFNFGSKLQELYLANCSLMDRSFLVPSAPIKNSSSSLVILNLSSNLLTSSTIFHWVFNFTTNLHRLDLFSNKLQGEIPVFNFTTNLHSLDLSYNELQGKIPVFNFTTNLHSLDLSYNKLQGEIPASLGNMCTLQKLYLSNNNLSGEISSFIQNSSWCSRHIFKTLDLSNNRITGLLPNLSIFSSLWSLDLSNNQLIGEIPKSIGLLSELKYLYLDGNYLEGDITESHFTNLSKLKVLDLTDNSLSLKFGTSWVPPFQIIQLGLASCKLGPSFPSWLQTQSYLSFLDISDAGINDSVPEWFWYKLQSISQMNMSYNNLVGTIPNLPLKLTDGETNVVLNSNQFEGGIPTFLSQASTLDFSKNKISDLNTFLCSESTTTNMLTLDLSDNQIKGQLPNCWEHLNSLNFLDLSNNNLSGKIPPSMNTFINLEALVLRNNSLIGELPSTLKNCTNLVILDVGENLLSGPIPSWIGESLQNLKILSLRVNGFFGTLPSHLCYLMQIQLLDLSRNNLSGRIPTCLKNFSVMTEKSIISTGFVRERQLSTKHSNLVKFYESNVLLTWKGQEYVFKNPELLLKSIDLSSNHLTCEIPTEFGQLLGLVSLNLSRNNLSGEIPYEIGNLNSLEFLDLSRNHFSGRIPSTLSQIDDLAVLDLSNNSLSGKIPLGTQLQSFDASSFEGNLDLCGKPLDKSCPEDETPVKPQGPAQHDKNDNSIFYEALYMSTGLGYFTGVWGFLGPVLLWRPWRNAYLRFLNKLTDYVYVMAVVNVVRCRRWLKD